MKINRENKLIAFTKALNVIKSCKNKEQLKIAKNYVGLFVDKYVNSSSYRNGYGFYDIWYEDLRNRLTKKEKELCKTND